MDVEQVVAVDVSSPRRGWTASLLCLALALAGCAHRQKGFRCELPPPLHLTLMAEADLNPSDGNEALPTTVRLFQLASLTKAETLDARDFWDKAAEALGPDLVAQEELTLEPGEHIGRWLTRKGPTNYLLAVAMFRKPQGTSWRALVPLTPVDEDACPAEAPAPRVGEPGREDAKVLFTLKRYLIEGTRVGGSR